MNLDAILSAVTQNAECRRIFRKLDEDGFQKMRVCIKTAVAYENTEERFFECCTLAGLVIPEPPEDEKLSSKDRGISPSDVTLIGNQLIKIKKDKQEPQDKKDRQKK